MKVCPARGGLRQADALRRGGELRHFSKGGEEILPDLSVNAELFFTP